MRLSGKNNKIHKDEVDWLISVYKTSDDEELENESFEKLVNYGFDTNKIEERFKKIKTEKDELNAFKKAWEKQEERNQFEKYTLVEKIKIFLFGPYELFKFFDSGLTELTESNYKTKFRQRLVLLITGTIFWILIGVATYQYYEYKRIQDIEKVDITNWENNRIKNE
ncbi:hypothetical protein SAMN05444285_1626 [Draconibacterium orientale]|uniref:Uncharacterized protein n=1 Tax=Draconibacterium orientale TaxID=1168034 RepID=X5DNW3_9BACT|nr:hypothetical protein [Draconibacterium orientale]AHW62332.1 hypothetical protein FH5T_19815 [Draconibacterium orientale]SEU15796.1 hypothetical protein SAMN05444285_1626 [Draconibacterium orientale]